MECKLSELVKLGHDQAAELKSSCGAVDVRDVAQLISDLATQLDVMAVALQEMTRKRDAEHGDVLAWEKTMFKACGEDGHKSVAAKFAALEAKCAALAAENAGLKSWAQVRATSDDALEQDNYMILKIDWRQRSLAEIKTPATDSFLAEVRAQGVEMYADNLDSSADDAERDGFDDAVKFLRSESSGVRLFAAQLRKGVQS
ncbi:hypothetical protein ACLEUQ_00550 [Escherichia coli]